MLDSSKRGRPFNLSAKLRRAPLRLASGAFILNTGLGKLHGTEETAVGVHSMASRTYPFLAPIPPSKFLKILGAGEVALGGAILCPVVPAWFAGTALTGFSGSLLNIYWQTPGMHEPNDPRPTRQGTPLAKDIWLLGIGTALVVDALISRPFRGRRPTERG